MTAFDKKVNQIAARHRWNIEKQARAAVPCYIIAAPTYEDTGKIVAVLNRCKGLYHETLTPIHYESWAVKVYDAGQIAAYRERERQKAALVDEPKAEYLLSGKLFCAKCGCTMKGVSGHSGGNGEVYRYYACSNPQCRKRNIPKDDLEGKVIRSICDHLLQPETIELLAETMVEVQKADMEKPNAERDVLEQELRDVRRRSKNIMDAIETGSANPQLVARLDDLTQQENTLTYQLSTMEAEKPLLFTKEQYLFLLQQFYAQPTEQDDAYKRRLINTFVTNIEVSDSELLIYFNISEETENKNKNAPQLNFDKSSSTEKRLVQQS